MSSQPGSTPTQPHNRYTVGTHSAHSQSKIAALMELILKNTSGGRDAP